jgi:hypothetical protein
VRNVGGAELRPLQARGSGTSRGPELTRRPLRAYRWCKAMETGSGLRGAASHSGTATGWNLTSRRGQASAPTTVADSTNAPWPRAAAHSRSVGWTLPSGRPALRHGQRFHY